MIGEKSKLTSAAFEEKRENPIDHDTRNKVTEKNHNDNGNEN